MALGFSSLVVQGFINQIQETIVLIVEALDRVNGILPNGLPISLVQGFVDSETDKQGSPTWARTNRGGRRTRSTD